jgi:hypothetical protein
MTVTTHFPADRKDHTMTGLPKELFVTSRDLLVPAVSGTTALVVFTLGRRGIKENTRPTDAVGHVYEVVAWRVNECDGAFPISPSVPVPFTEADAVFYRVGHGPWREPHRMIDAETVEDAFRITLKEDQREFDAMRDGTA